MHYILPGHHPLDFVRIKPHDPFELATIIGSGIDYTNCSKQAHPFGNRSLSAAAGVA